MRMYDHITEWRGKHKTDLALQNCFKERSHPILFESLKPVLTQRSPTTPSCHNALVPCWQQLPQSMSTKTRIFSSITTVETSQPLKIGPSSHAPDFMTRYEICRCMVDRHLSSFVRSRKSVLNLSQRYSSRTNFTEPVLK